MDYLTLVVEPVLFAVTPFIAVMFLSFFFKVFAKEDKYGYETICDNPAF